MKGAASFILATIILTFAPGLRDCTALDFSDYPGVEADFDVDVPLRYLRRREASVGEQDFAQMQKADVTTSKAWIDDILTEHNRLRDLHGSPALTLDEELCKTAQFWANYLGQVSEGRTLPLLFRKGWYDVGGNMWAAVGRKDANHISPTFAWYNEERWYTYGNDSYCGMDPLKSRHHVDHFTQLLWKGSRSVGCAKVKNKSKHIYVVCHYRPPGNVRGLYNENVPLPLRAQ